MWLITEISNKFLILSWLDRKMFEEWSNDGWQRSEDEIETEQDTITSVGFRIEKGLSILQSRQHSLEPDMISGWRPKLPSCPLPISYPNHYLDSLIKHLERRKEYKVVYFGPRYINSVQINQQYNYHWRYRDRYSLNLAIVKEAVRNVGKQSRQCMQVSPANHVFDSAFESGNLDMAVQVKRNEYDCFIRSDTNTKGHTNWYYFKVKSTSEGPIRINICNMTKTRNLYSKGMKPYVRVGAKGKWTQNGCQDVVFVERFCRYGLEKKTYQLQFNYHFCQPNQEVYFAYGIPYTYTDLEKFVDEIKCQHSTILKVEKLCESLGGIDLPLMTITNPEKIALGSENQPVNYSSRKKKAVLITARIHPGQSHSSYVLEGYLREILSDSQEACILRDMFVFYVVPMLNPDGVIAGNFRTSYIGKDLNRQFSKLNKYLFPEITALCQFCQNLRKSYLRGIQFYFDFHGHSAKKNLFCYGPEHNPNKIYYYKARALAKIIEKMHPIFSYKKSIFTISEHKKTTGRAYMLNKLKIPMTFTFQVSNGMYQNDKKANILLDKNILLEAGLIVFKGVFRYVQLEMKIPRRIVKPKVDTKNPKKKLYSGKSIRHNSQMLKKRPSNQVIDFRVDKTKAEFDQDEKCEKNKEFLALIKEIKHEENFIEIEGGSDSESSEQDFSKEEANHLVQQIMKKNNCKDYKNQCIPKIKNRKLLYRKEQSENSYSKPQELNNEEPENKKYRSSRLFDLSKAPPKILKKNISIECQKVVVAQKNFTMLI